MVCKKLISTYSIVKMTNIYTVVGIIYNCYCKFNGSSFGSIYNDLSFTICNRLADFCSHSGVFVALVRNIDSQVTINLSEVAIFIDNFYSYFVVFVDSTFCRIEFEGECVVGINNSQFDRSIDTVFIAVANYSDSGTKQGFISCNIRFSSKGFANLFINSSFPIATNYCFAIFSINL